LRGYGFVFFLFLGLATTIGATIEAGGRRRVTRAGEDVCFECSALSKRDSVSLDEFFLPRGVTSLSSFVLSAPEEAEKEEEDAMSLPRCEVI